MSTTNDKLKEEFARVISTILMSVVAGCQHGELELAERLGFPIETIRALTQLPAHQIHAISGIYVRDIEAALDVVQLNTSKILRIIEIAAEEKRQAEMIDEYLTRGACKTMMAELFGLRSTQVAARKRILNLPTVKGRLPISTIDEQRRIYDAWLNTIKVADYRERLLLVGRQTDLSMSRIYREIQEIEHIENHRASQKICA